MRRAGIGTWFPISIGFETTTFILLSIFLLLETISLKIEKSGFRPRVLKLPINVSSALTHDVIRVAFKGEYHGIAHVLAVANAIVYKAIRSDVIISAGNLHVRVKVSLSP